MRGSSLLVDDIVLDHASVSARLVRTHVEFETDVWIAIGDAGTGKTFGPVRVRKRGIQASTDRFPDIILTRDGPRVGVRTSLYLAANTVYILGLPQNYVPDLFTLIVW